MVLPEIVQVRLRSTQARCDAILCQRRHDPFAVRTLIFPKGLEEPGGVRRIAGDRHGPRYPARVSFEDANDTCAIH